MQPTVARVENVDTLKKSNPDFYKNVAAGDYLILYPQRAVIYRKTENKIMNVAPIVAADKPAAEQTTGTVSTP
jgi:hypothetical protein